jgi:uncharacterized repeat protein (TIGR01451 family)
MIKPVADLSLFQTANPNPSMSGELLTYTLTASNNGPSESESVVLTDTLPNDVAFQSTSPSQGSCSAVGEVVTCEIGRIPAGSSATVQIKVIPSRDGRFVANNAEVRSGTEDFFPDNNIAVLTTIVSAACPAPLYGAAADENGLSILYAIDPVTGTSAPVGPIGFRDVSGMDFHPSTGVLYATADRVDDDGRHHVLITIDPCSGAGTEVGATNIEIVNFNSSSPDISFRNSDGKLFAYLMLERDLATIDIVTGRASAVGSTSAAGREGNGIAFAPDDTLYHADGLNLNTLNPVTGLASRRFGLGFSPPADRSPQINGLDFDPASGILFGSLLDGSEDASDAESYLATVDILTGAVTIIGPTVRGLDALAFTDAPANHAPTITSDGGGESATLSVRENSKAVTRVTAEDPDVGARLTFTIVAGTDGQLFAIDATTGELTFVAMPNFEDSADANRDNVYDVTVQVSDGRLIDRQAIMVEVTNALELQSFEVQRGATQRSFVRYVDLVFDGADELQQMLDDGRIQLTRFDLNGVVGEPVNLAGRLTRNGAALAIDFGIQGISGNRNTNTGDGYYRFGIDSDGDGTFETTRSFYRLLGDVTGDRIVSDADVAAIALAIGRTGLNLAEDVNGDGVVNALDRLYAIRAKGRRLAEGLFVDDGLGINAVQKPHREPQH